MKRSKVHTEDDDLLRLLVCSKKKYERKMDRIYEKYFHPFENDIGIHLSELHLKYPGTFFTPCEACKTSETCLPLSGCVKGETEGDVHDITHQSLMKKRPVYYQRVKFDDLIEPECASSPQAVLFPVYEPENTNNNNGKYPGHIFGRGYQTEVIYRPVCSGSDSAVTCSSYASNSDFKCRTGGCSNSTVLAVTSYSNSEGLLNKFVCATNRNDLPDVELSLLRYCSDLLGCHREMLSFDSHCNVTVAEMYPSLLQMFFCTVKRNCKRATYKTVTTSVRNFYRGFKQKRKLRDAIAEHPRISRRAVLNTSSHSGSSFSFSQPKACNSHPSNNLLADVELVNAVDFQSSTGKKKKNTDCCLDFCFSQESPTVLFPSLCTAKCSKPVGTVLKTQYNFPVSIVTTEPDAVVTESSYPWKHSEVRSASLSSRDSEERRSSSWSSYYPGPQRSQKEILDEFEHLHQSLVEQNKVSPPAAVRLEQLMKSEALSQSGTVNTFDSFSLSCLPIKRKLKDKPNTGDVPSSSSVKKLKTVPDNKSPLYDPKCSFYVADDILLQNAKNDTQKEIVTGREYSRNICSVNAALGASHSPATHYCSLTLPSYHEF